MNKKNLTPFVATHPGEMIKDELKERGMTQKQLAAETGIKPSVLSETINGKRSVSLNVAVALEKALGIPADIWMNLQTLSLNVTISARQLASLFLSETEICFRNLCANSAGLAYFNPSRIIFRYARLASVFYFEMCEILLIFATK